MRETLSRNGYIQQDYRTLPNKYQFTLGGKYWPLYMCTGRFVWSFDSWDITNRDKNCYTPFNVDITFTNCGHQLSQIIIYGYISTF